MQIALFSLGTMALTMTASAALAQSPTAPKPVYGPRLEPASVFEPGRDAPELPVKLRPLKERPYERAVDDWKARQYRCMQRGSLCFETKPLPSDLLETPLAR